MAPFLFRDTRIDCNLPVWVGLQSGSTLEELPGRIEATLINVSKGGACLLTPTLLLEGNHIFFKTLNSSHNILLQHHESLVDFTGFIVTARSVWMDSCFHMDKQYFKVGLCFASPQKDLFEAVKKLR